MRTWALAVALVSVFALTSCTLLPTPAVDVTHLPSEVQSPFADTGPAKDQTAVRASLVDALSTEEDQLARTEQGSPLHPASARRTRLLSVETAPLATRDLAAMAYLTAADTPFRSSHFTVASWQGVAVHGNHAKAYVLGHNTYLRWDGTRHGEPQFQYKALLRRDPRTPHGWTLTAYKAASNDQG